MSTIIVPDAVRLLTPARRNRTGDWCVIEFRDDQVVHVLDGPLKRGVPVQLSAQGSHATSPSGAPLHWRHRFWTQIDNKWEIGSYNTGTHRYHTVSEIHHAGTYPRTGEPHATVRVEVLPEALSGLHAIPAGPFTFMVMGTTLLLGF